MKGLLFFLCFTVTVAFAQSGTSGPDSSQVFSSIGDWRSELDNPDANYLYIVQQIDSIISCYPSINYEFKEWLRFENFWSTRYGYDNSSPGKIADYTEAINSWVASELICPDDEVVWTNIGADIVDDGSGTVLCANGIVTAVYMNPANTEEIIIGTNVSGIWKTIDGGDHWLCKTDDLRYPGLGIQDITVHPTDPSKLIACTGKSTYGNTYGVGILVSDDAGETWERNESFPYLDFPMTYQAIINPANTNEILVLTNTKLFRSLNFGLTWNVAFDLNGDPVSHDIAYSSTVQALHTMHLTNDGVLFIGGLKRFAGSTQIWKGVPGSGTWTDIRNEFSGVQSDEILSVYFTEDGDGDIYVGLSDNANFHIYKSNDGGATFNFFNNGEENPVGLDKIVFSAALTGTDRIYSGSCGLFVKYSSSFNTLYTDDCSLAGPFFHTDMRSSQIIIDQLGNEILIVGHDGGVTIFDITGDPISGFNSQQLANGQGLSINQMYSISISQFTSKELITGNQDNSSFRYNFGSNQWTKFSSGDGHETWYSSDGSRYMNCANAGINTNGISGVSSTSVSGWTLNMPVEIDEKTNTMYYRGNQYIDGGTAYPLRLYKKDNGYTNVLNVPLSSPLKKVTEIAYCESDINTIYFSGGVHATGLTNGESMDKFFKSIDGFQTYTNISGSPVTDADGLNSIPLNQAMAYRIISAIKIDPANPDHLWVGLSGASATPWGDHRDYRCLESLDGGLTWRDYSEGLPLLPVNDLEFIKGTNGQLIAGTDVGLFVRNAEDTQWHCYQGNMPVSVITDIAIDYCEEKIYVATYGRGAWVTDLTFTTSSEFPELVITDAMDIEETYNCASAIRILDGATLNVSGILYMNEGTKIIVEQGGKLIINGGTITNACGGFWNGIEVWGTTAESQFGNAQGEVVMSNGAKIEHAEVAVALWKPSDWTATGGIIRAYNSVFKNNKKDVEFISYSNDYNGSHYPNKGQFTDCNFFWDDEFRDNDPLGHATLYRVDGVKFLGCTFADKRTPGTYIITPESNIIGIKSIDANYRVAGRCTGTGSCTGEIDAPGTNWDPTIFENLYFGIYASNATSTYSINVDRCIFTDNGYGVLISAMPSPVIVRSKFEFTDLSTHAFTPFTMYGIHAVNSKILKIEENKFIDSDPGGNTTFGIVSSDLGEQDERIYKNSFQGLSYANFAQGNNGNSSFAGASGLSFPCNSNTNNNSDHNVVSTLWGLPATSPGVRPVSGSPTVPTGSSFSADPGNLIHLEDYSNTSTQLIRYWHHSTQIPDDYGLFTVQMNLSGVISNNQCWSTLTNYSSGVGKLTPTDKSAFINDFFLISTRISTAETNYLDSILNASETTTVMTAIDGLRASNKASVRSLLISYSPYLTTEIFFALADHDSTDFDHAWLRDLLLANIEAVTPDLLTFLETKNHPLPPAMLNEVSRAVGTTYSNRSVFESYISQLYADRVFYSNQLITGIIHDSTDFNTDSLRYWLGNQRSILHQQFIIDSYLQDEDFTSADAANSAYAFSDPPEHLRQEVKDFTGFKTNLLTIVQTPGLIANLNEGQLNDLRYLASSGTGTARYQAQNILCFFYNECDYYYFEAPVDTRAPENQSETFVSGKPSSFKMYPNPSSGYVTIELTQESYEQLENAEVLITDLTGKLVLQTNLTKNTYLWEAEDIQNGVYLVMIKSTSGLFETQKLIINR